MYSPYTKNRARKELLSTPYDPIQYQNWISEPCLVHAGLKFEQKFDQELSDEAFLVM